MRTRRKRTVGDNVLQVQLSLVESVGARAGSEILLTAMVWPIRSQTKSPGATSLFFPPSLSLSKPMQGGKK